MAWVRAQVRRRVLVPLVPVLRRTALPARAVTTDTEPTRSTHPPRLTRLTTKDLARHMPTRTDTRVDMASRRVSGRRSWALEPPAWVPVLRPLRTGVKTRMAATPTTRTEITAVTRVQVDTRMALTVLLLDLLVPVLRALLEERLSAPPRPPRSAKLKPNVSGTPRRLPAVATTRRHLLAPRRRLAVTRGNRLRRMVLSALAHLDAHTPSRAPRAPPEEPPHPRRTRETRTIRAAKAWLRARLA